MLLIKKAVSGAVQADFEGFLHGYNLRMRLNCRRSKILDRKKEIENGINRIRSASQWKLIRDKEQISEKNQRLEYYYKGISPSNDKLLRNRKY